MHSPNRREFLQHAALFASAATCPALAAAEDAAPGADGLRRITAWLQGQEPVTWVFTGDSITHGALHTLGWRSYPEHFAERVRWELHRHRDVVINTGISGDRTAGVLKDLEWRVLRFQPQVVSLMFGMNDCNEGEKGRAGFRQNYTEILDRITAAGGVPILNTPNTVYVAKSAGRADLPAYAEIIRELAAEKKVPLVDHWKFWSTTKPEQEQLLRWLHDQSIHPGVYGHRAFAQEIFRVLGIFDAQSPTCTLEL